LYFGSATAESSVNAAIEVWGDLEAEGNVTFNAAYTAASETQVRANAQVQFEAQATLYTLRTEAESRTYFHSDTSISSSVYLDSTSRVECHGSLYLNGSVTSNSLSSYGTIEFTSESDTEVESTVEASYIEAHVFISNAARLVIATTYSTEAEIEGDLTLTGNAVLAVASDSALTVQGSANFAADTTYELALTGAEATSYATVVGEANLNGNLHVTLEADLETDASATVIAYGSRATDSVFASLTVQVSTKRSLLQSDGDYEVTYNDDGAVITSTTSDETTTNSASGLVLSALLLVAYLF
jgi:hypothetical protein